MREIKPSQLIDNLQQLALDIHDFILDHNNQQTILKFLTGIDILPKNNKVSSIAVLKLITEYFINYAWEIDSVNTTLLRELIKKLPQPQYQSAITNQENLDKEIILRLKDLFLLKAHSTLLRHETYTSQKLKQTLIDAFLRKKFRLPIDEL